MLALTMLVPAAFDLADGNRDWQSFILSAAATGTAGGFLIAACLSDTALELEVRDAFVLTAATWVVVPAFAALPLIGQGVGYTDAFFEAMSGLTTTGSTVLSGLDGLPAGILVWRALLQWVGGIGIIVMAIVILPFLRVGGMQLFRTESSERSEKIVPNAFSMVAWILAVYGALTLICGGLFVATGMTALDALCHALATLSTGGFSTHDASFGYFQAPATEWVATAFMLAGGLPFVAYIRMVQGDRLALLREPQVRGLLIALILIVLLGAGMLVLQGEYAPLDALRKMAFNTVSIVTTTGFASVDYTLWGPFFVALFFVLTFSGACAGSTSGGIKVYRLQVLWLSLVAYLARTPSPHRVVVLRYGGRRLPDDVPFAVLGFLAAFLGSVALVTVLLGALGVDFVTALTAASTAMTNVGPGLGEIVGPAGNFASMPDAAKWILAFAMMLGRLEVFTILIVLDPRFWRH
ncbi:MAG: TrkH family potassium uptake protein [Sneathiellaceae bacterium]